MARVIVLGAGMCGLTTAILLARDGHEVTVLERDPAEPPPAGQEWREWQRPGVHQFRRPHLMLPRWRALMEIELPEVLAELAAAGGLRINLLSTVPTAQRGPWRDGDDRFETLTARRPVLEAALAGVAATTAGVTIRRGVTGTGFLTDASAGGPVPRITGVLTAGGGPLWAELVVDCGGRRSALPSWLAAAGARRPAEERADCGFVYYSRHFRSRTGVLPVSLTYPQQRHESMTVLTLPCDNGTWTASLIVSSRDRALRVLHDADRWDAALALYPLAAHWRDGEPISGVDASAGIEDRYRSFVVDGVPVATGVVAVGDSWACTNPSLGRGVSIGLLHACGLRDVLRDTDCGDHDKLAHRFHEWTTANLAPLYRATLWHDQHRLAELDADAAGVPYRTDDPAWALALAMIAASHTDPDITRSYLSLASLLATTDEVFGDPRLTERITTPGGRAPTYPLPGPGRRDLLAAVGAG